MTGEPDPVKEILDAVARGRYSRREIRQMILEARYQEFHHLEEDEVEFMIVVRTPPPERAKLVTRLRHPEREPLTPEMQAVVRQQLQWGMRQYLEDQR